MTFAGSPERVEARLVAEAGYPFDPFTISGFPRLVDDRSLDEGRAVVLRGEGHTVEPAGPTGGEVPGQPDPVPTGSVHGTV